MTEKTEITEKITQLLDQNGVKYELVEHKPVYTSAEAAEIRETALTTGAKALVVMADKEPALVVVPGDKKLNFAKFKAEFAVNDLYLVSPEKVTELTGLEVGAIPPVGRVLNLPSYYDVSFKDKEMVSFNAGSHTISIKMHAADLLKIEKPVISSIT